MNKEIEYKIPIHETQAINKKRISKENEEWKGNSIAKKIQKRKKPATIRFLKRRFHETKALEIDFEIKKGFHKDNNRHLSLDSQISLLPLGFSPQRYVSLKLRRRKPNDNEESPNNQEALCISSSSAEA